MDPRARTDLFPMTPDAFTAWSLDSESRWELLAGIPVRMQTETRTDSRTANRIMDLLVARLTGSSFTPDQRLDVLCGDNEIRNADVVIDCSPEAETSDSSRALEPTVIFEVAVTSQAYDLGGKHETYFLNPHVQHYIVVLPAERRVIYFKRDTVRVILSEGDVLSLSPRPILDIPVEDLLLPA